jgi:hypothetical protein
LYSELVAVFVLYDIDQVFLILYPDSFKVDIGVGSEGISYNLLERKLSPHYIDTFLTKTLRGCYRRCICRPTKRTRV